MDLKKWLQETYNELQDTRYTGVEGPIVCGDGFRIRIRAGYGAYSNPGENLPDGNYETVEVVRTSREEKLLCGYMENMQRGYKYVPVSVVEDIIRKHGGMIQNSREILFCGKRNDNGKWIEGYYFKVREKTFILEIRELEEHAHVFAHEVISSTVCQFTGMIDGKGNKIWENDIVNSSDGNLKVMWNHTYASWCTSNKGKIHQHHFGEYIGPEEMETIGNSFDNKELLEDKREKS